MPTQMAGESVQRRSARKRATTTRYSDAAEPAKSSPSQNAKRRKTAARAPKASRQPDQDEDTEHDSSTDIEEAGDTAELTEIADKIVPFLNEAHYQVQVLSEFPSRPEDQIVSAFAKIAGLGWNYYVTSASINIGRAPTERQSETGIDLESEESKIHIDLGPSKTVSRLHAAISYNSEDEMWHLVVHSRNGAKVNEELLRRTGERALKSGDVIEIAGTEMIFISPNEKAKVEQIYLDRMKGKQQIKSDASKATSKEIPEPLALPRYETPAHISPYALPGEQPITDAADAADISVAARPATPINSIMSAPYLNQSNAGSQFDHMNTMESNEHIDYASDNAKDIKPPMSYATLIGQAILSHPSERLSLNGIYEWIKTNFSYYRYIEPGWQNSIRHNLSLSASFSKRPREAHEPGKGGLWYIIEDKREAFKKEGLKTTSRGGARQPSNPNSPAPSRKSPKKEAPPTFADQSRSTISSTPPVPTLKLQTNGARTPSKPPVSIGVLEPQQLPQLSQDTSPLPRAQPYLSNTTGSPSGLSSTVFLAEPTTGFNFQTPMPQRAQPQFTVPRTNKLPSQWLPQSSPNMWHIDINNKPFPFDSSPIKGNGDDQTGGIRSSSPPVAEASPTRSRASPLTAQVNGNVIIQSDMRQPEPARPQDDEDMPIDLMAGSFTAIGASALG